MSTTPPTPALPTPPIRLLVCVAAALLLAACGGGGVGPSPAESPSPTTPSSTAATTTPTPTSSPTPSPSPPSPTATGTTIEVVVSEGQVQGGVQRIPVELGEQVTLTVASDVADEVHLHVYDRHADVSAGGTASIEFTADIPGVIEAELEQSGIQLIELEVR